MMKKKDSLGLPEFSSLKSPYACRERITKIIRIMIYNFDCRGQRMMERIIADRQTIYARVEFISWKNDILSLFLA